MPHPVVDAAAGEDDFRIVLNLLGPVGQVIGIDPDAVPAHQTGLEIEEVPLGVGGIEDVIDRNPELVKDHGHFIDEGDVDVALRILDHLGGLGRLDAGGAKDLARGDPPIDRRQLLDDLGGLARYDLGDPAHRVLPVARIDALGRIAQEEIRPACKP